MGKNPKKNGTHKAPKAQKKPKPVYIDDGSTISDMSGVGRSRFPISKENPGSRATLGEMFRTYTDAVRMMFLPMLAVLGIIAVAFLLVYFLL